MYRNEDMDIINRVEFRNVRLVKGLTFVLFYSSTVLKLVTKGKKSFSVHDIFILEVTGLTHTAEKTRCMIFADCRPQTADCRLQTADHRLQIEN